MRHHSLLALVALCCLVGGCFPARFTVAPEINGRVVDADGRPVPGATVVVTELTRAKRCISLRCDASGCFYRKAEAPWGLYIIPMDAFGCLYEAVPTTNGQRGEAREFGTAWAQVRFLGLGAVQQADLGDLKVAPRPPDTGMDREAALKVADRTVRTKVTWEPVLMNGERKPGRWEFLYYGDDNVIGHHALVTVSDDGSVDFLPGH